MSSVRASGGTTLACDDLIGWPTASKVHFVTYQVDTNSDPLPATQLDCSGIVSGNTINSFTVIDGTDSGNSVGDVVEMLPTSAWGQDLADAVSAEHSRTGTHSPALITSRSTKTTPTTSDIFLMADAADSNALKKATLDKAVPNGSVLPNKLMSSASTANNWSWDTWTPTLSGRFNDGKWTKACSYIQIGKTVICNLSLTANAATPMDGGVSDCFITLPVTSKALDLTANIQLLATVNIFDANGAIYLGPISLASTTTAVIRHFDTDGAGKVLHDVILSTAPMTWASGDQIGGFFIYEAA